MFCKCAVNRQHNSGVLKTQTCTRNNLWQKILSTLGGDSLITSQTLGTDTSMSKSGVCLLMGGWDGEFYPNPFLLIRGLDSRRTLANGCRRPLGRRDILGAAHGHQSCGLCAGLGGDWGQTPWAHPLVLQASSKPALISAAATHFLFIVLVLSRHAIGMEQRCFNLTAAASW